MLLTKENKKIKVILKRKEWTIDIGNCSNTNIVILNKLHKDTIEEIGDGCHSGHIQCEMGQYEKGGMWDQISLITNDKLNKDYNLEVMDNEVLDIFQLFTRIMSA